MGGGGYFNSMIKRYADKCQVPITPKTVATNHITNRKSYMGSATTTLDLTVNNLEHSLSMSLGVNLKLCVLYRSQVRWSSTIKY